MDDGTERDPTLRSVRSRSGARLTRREVFGVLSIGALAGIDSACTQGEDASVPEGGAQLHFASLSDVARLIKTRALSPVELTELMLGRIESIDPRLMSYATVTADRAREAALRAEQQILAGDYRGPLHGVPVSVKDVFHTRGVRTMVGSAVFRDFVADYDATVVARLENAGAVLLGKTNLPEGVNVGYHPDFQIPVNPWREDLWAGASSSGSAVAVAAGLCYASLGTDTGGSIRAPSAANGVVGLKPTYGRVSRHGVFPLPKPSTTLDP